MNFEQLEYIVYVANEKSISKAAEKLYISTSAISQSISQLERELNITIFNRSRIGTTPTPEGNIVITKAINILSNIKQLNEELFSLNIKKEKQLKIVAATAFFDIFQEAVTNFNLENPQISIDVEEMLQEQLLKSFNPDRYDVGFLPIEKEELDKYPKLGKKLINRARIGVVVGKNSKLFNYEYVTPADLNNEKIAVLKNTKNSIVKKFSKCITNHVILTTNNPRLLLNVVKESAGFSFIHEFTVKNYPTFRNDELKVIPITYTDETNYIYQDIWAIYSREHGLSSSSSEIIKHILFQLNK
ncbi:LysR family transcriptional regulator [Gottfriedia acidiceleris]|uniref:LysR family transcriptional regulator n=1 Tax=Gottfriedia acidiceleris TaxID=371036 RepID=UPI000B42D1A8|nr:LysR family transcriptional regulator [Gottfriedia acidiceleris]